MGGLRCNACNKEFKDESQQKFHYKSDWHRYNLKRKVAGVPGITEALFLSRLQSFSYDKDKSSETLMLYSCRICGKEYRSSKAHAQHLNSRSHIMRASQETTSHEEDAKVMVKPLRRHAVDKHPQVRNQEIEESEDEWEEVGSKDEDMVADLDEDVMDEDGDEYLLDPSSCFMCDQEHGDIESCMIHMHRYHGFFIPDIEYLKDPRGLLTFLGLKVKRDFICLYCNDRCHPFSSLEAVRKHMAAKSHCKVHYGDGGEDEEADLEEFYDYSSSYVDEAGKQLVVSGGMANTVELGCGGSELVITSRSNGKTLTKTLGSREFLRYYRQKPRPSSANDRALTIALASRYRSMGLATVQLKEQMVRMKVLKEMNRSGVDAMRNKIGLKNNVIRNLPKNVPY